MPNTIEKQNKLIYLDHAASTPVDKSTLEAMVPHFSESYGNPSSLHQTGRHAHDILSAAREGISNTLNVRASEIIFTSSGTESDNLAILGLARANKSNGNHIIVSSIEHKAILCAAKRLENEGFFVTYLPVDSDGLVRLEDVEKTLTDKTILVSIMYANNEIGTIQPIKNISNCIHEHYKDKQRPLIHTDACQAPGMLPVLPAELGVDAMTLNSSKIYGPKGIGLLYLSSSTKIEPQSIGGDQEHSIRAGTENIALAVGFSKALCESIDNKTKNSTRLSEMQNDFVSHLKKEIPNVIFNGHKTNRLPNNVNICIPDVEGESIVLMLDHYGICCSTGSACSARNLEPSHVLQAIGRDDEIIHGSIRFTFGKNTTSDDLTYTAKILKLVVERLAEMTASTVLTKKR